MSEAEEKNEKQEQAEAKSEDKAPAKKSGLLKYIIMGVGAIVLIVGVAFGVLMFTGSSKPVPEEQTEQTAQTDNTEHETDAAHADEKSTHEGEAEHGDVATQDDEEMPESLLAAAAEEMDNNMLEMINENLAALDWQPDPSELEGADIGMSVEDSLKEVNWLEKEKADIEKRKKELDKREKELNKLNREVTQKLLRLEQAESTRINNLAKLYDSMDPRSVARLMANLDDETVVSIIPRMKTKNASAVLQLLPAKRAARLSKQMITIAEK